MNGPGDRTDGHRIGTTIPEQDMRALLDDGRAEPLLPDTFPVPARYDDRWWHQPAGSAVAAGDADSDSGAAAPFVPASVEQAARYEDLLRRRRHAHTMPVGEPPDA